MTKLLKDYPECIFCKNTKLKTFKQSSEKNFYINALIKDLQLNYKFLDKIKIKECKRCGSLQNNPWFNEEISQKIYTNIYGQHNKNWSNVINFFNTGKLHIHGNLFELINKNLKIKNYGEYKTPFMGLMLDYFLTEYKYKKKEFKKYFNLNIEYLKSRQVAGKNKKIQIECINRGNKILLEKNKINTNLLKKVSVKKYLLNDFSRFSWGINDNYKSVNSLALANEIFNNFKIINLHEKNIPKFDLFGIFLTLDHSENPKKILDFALKNSKYVIVNCHTSEKLNKQHLFTFTKKIINYLGKCGIYTKNINNYLNNKTKNSEIYFVCSRKNQIKF